MKRSSSKFFLSAGILLLSLSLRAAEPYQTVYLIPEDSVEVKASISNVDRGGSHQVANCGFGIGVFDNLSLWYSVDYIGSWLGSRGVSGAGDSHPYVRWYLGGGESFHAALTAGMTLPTGGDVYRNVDWAGLSFGNYELFSGALFRYDLGDFVLSGAARYTFRQAMDERFFSQSFFASSRLRNDYLNGYASVMAAHLYPLTLYASVSASVRVWKRTTQEDELPVEGCGVNPVSVSAGVRWFFSKEAFFAAYMTEEMIRRDKYPRRSAGFSLSLLF